MVSVWFATVPLIDVLTEPDGVIFEKALVKAVEPPVVTVPETTRSVLSLCEVSFVQPVGAAVC